MFLCIEKVLKVKKPNVYANRSSSVPQKTLLRKHPISSFPWCPDITKPHHVTHWRTLCLNSQAEIKLSGSWKHDRANWRHSKWCWLRPVWAGQSEQTECLGGWALKRQELKQSISDRRGMQSCSTVQYEKTDVFLKVKIIKSECLIEKWHLWMLWLDF